MEMDKMDSLLEKRIRLAHLPTPVQHLPRLSESSGVELFVKRDDLTESVASGNKLRKLEYLLYAAEKEGADTLVTCGGLQSNHCRAVAWAAARMGYSCTLLLRGEKPEGLQGNLLMDRLLGAELKFYPREAFAEVSKTGEPVCAELAAAGKKPYYIPMGGSNATGSLGYVNMIREIAKPGERFDHIYCALGSGGTFAGLWAGCRLLAYSARVCGIAVCDDTAYFQGELNRIGAAFSSRHGIDIDFDGAANAMDDRHVGEGYGINTDMELRELVAVARLEGMVLDPVYTLKAFLGLAAHIREGRIQRGDKVLFLHSGGHYGLFPKNSELAPHLT